MPQVFLCVYLCAFAPLRETVLFLIVTAWAFGFGRELAQPGTHLLFTPTAPDRQCHLRARLRRRNRIPKLVRIRNRRPIKRADHITLFQPRTISSTSTLHLVNNHARTLRDTKLRRLFRRNRQHNDPKLATPDLARVDELFHHVASHV